MVFRDNWKNRPPKTYYMGEFKLITEQSHIPTSTLVETMIQTGKYLADSRQQIYDEENMNLDPNRIPNADLTDFQKAAIALASKRDDLNDANKEKADAATSKSSEAEKVSVSDSAENV